MNLTQREHEISVFLCQAIYTKVGLPLAYEKKHSIKKISGLRADIFEFEQINYVTFSGTNGLFGLNDWCANLKIGLGIKPKQFTQALEFVVGELDQNKRTIVCGHSLGGGIAMTVGNSIKHDNLIVVTFNPAGVLHMVKPKHDKNIYNFVTSKDILDRISRLVPGSYLKHLGEKHYIIDFDSSNGVKSHSNWKLFYEHKIKGVEVNG